MIEKRSIGASRRPSPHELWARAEAQARRRKLEDLFEHQLLAHGLPKPEREFRFDAVRRWRFDFAWLEFGIAVEVDGGTLSRGRHVRPQGFEADAEKMNAATTAGWKVFRYTSTHVRSGYAVAQLRVELERAARAKHGLPA
jgi:very-short-patch-repair endonuclease